MKIKTVCDTVGLTDRTIRYYIEEQLISPAYTENYLGRKSFDFSQKDIEILKNISILRKFDFTIDEIRQITTDANTSSGIIANVKLRTEEAVSVGNEKLLALTLLRAGQIYTLEQLAYELSKPPIALPDHNELIKRNTKKNISALIRSLLIFMIVWSPILLSLFVLIISISDFHYPVFNYTALGLTIAAFWPSIGFLIISRTHWKQKLIVKRILLVLCVLSIPISFILSYGIITRSETSDIRNYRKLDANCLVNRYSFYQELFPAWPHYFVTKMQTDGSWKTEYSDTYYYYCSKAAFDYTYDIYAQWPLGEEDFAKEVARVQALFENHAAEGATDYNIWQNRHFEIIQTKNYTCYFLYNEGRPFEEVEESYTYYIFAYDEKNRVVRYILCDSLENGADQPYYLSLDW